MTIVVKIGGLLSKMLQPCASVRSPSRSWRGTAIAWLWFMAAAVH